MSRRLALASALTLVVACKPDLNETVSIVSSPTVLAVQSSPAEAAPMTKVTYTALVADGTGPLKAFALDWAYCTARNPLSNLGPVATSCIQPGSAALVTFGDGEQAAGPIPGDACSKYGPNAPPATGGMPAGRPVDPDPTGGYYQPIDALLASGSATYVTLYPMRLTCGFAGASETSQGELAARYHPNVNPKVESLSLQGGAALPTDDTGKTFTAQAGQKISIRVAWPACPTSDVCGDGVCGPDETSMGCPKDCKTPVECAGAERYVNFDLASQSVLVQRERMTVSWYATGGKFDSDATGRAGTDTITTSDNGWTAPSQAGPAHLWVVLHDERGGVGYAGYAIDVK